MKRFNNFFTVNFINEFIYKYPCISSSLVIYFLHNTVFKNTLSNKNYYLLQYKNKLLNTE